MILNALYDYYDLLAEDAQSGISPLGFKTRTVAYDVILTESGDVSSIISHVNSKGDKPKTVLMPKDMKRAGIAASPVCDNMTYIFGVEGKKGENRIDLRKFDAAKKLHLRLFDNAASKEALAVKSFFEKWDPNTAWQNEHILHCASEKGDAFSGNAAFRLQGSLAYFHECEEIKNIWLDENDKKPDGEEEYMAVCSVSGQKAPIAKLHTQLSGVKGAQATGASLVCFNKPSDISYNLEQSYNSRVSEMVMFKYTTVLQRFLSSQKNKLYMGDDTTVFWASSNNTIVNDTAFGLICGLSEDKNDKNQIELDKAAEDKIKTILEQGRKGIAADPDLKPETSFFVLGLAPNAGRISVRYFYRSSFGEFCDRIKKYHDETQLCGSRRYIKLGSLLYATISTKSSDKKVNPLLGGAVMRAVLSGGDYPQILFNQMILRVKAEAEVSQVRAAAIKAYLMRNKKREDITPVLNEKSENQAYILGRVFAVLEMIQKNASGGSLNSTIKDKYFARACSNPALVFPALLKLAQHHLSKLDGVFWDKTLGECLTLIEGEVLPKTQNMEKQGSFILGYYQQTQKLYEKKSNEA